MFVLLFYTKPVFPNPAPEGPQHCTLSLSR